MVVPAVDRRTRDYRGSLPPRRPVPPTVDGVHEEDLFAKDWSSPHAVLESRRAFKEASPPECSGLRHPKSL